VIKKCVEQEHNKGIFEALDGDVDTRDDLLKDVPLVKGFNT